MAEPAAVPVGAHACVLLVEDDAAVARAMARCLRAAGWAVTHCESGEEAIAVIDRNSFDVILSDIDLPTFSGIDLLELLRERPVEVPVILMTGGPALETAMKAVELGAFKYLVKPIDPPKLIDAVRDALGAGGRTPSHVRQRSADSAGSAQPESQSRSSVVPDALLSERYRLVRLIGEGGMSQVWEAVQVRTGRPIALKLLRAALNGRAEMRGRLLREARAASRVQHPNVVDLLDVFELPDGTPVLVMVLLRGRTLTYRLAEGRLSLTEAADLLLPVISAVGTAHARGVIHRDLKPENVFLADELDGRMTVKVLDFGIAKLTCSDEPDARLTTTGSVLGTPGYMAPEQWVGDRGIDHRADVWSIGSILYEALAGAPALPQEDVGP